MNEAIALLNNLNPKINQLGSSEPKTANGYVDAFNSRMNQVKELSQKPAPPKPVVKTTTITSTLGPVQQSGWKPEPEEYEVTLGIFIPVGGTWWRTWGD